MPGIRFYDLAKELGMAPARLRSTMGKLGIKVRSVSSLVAAADASQVRRALGRPEPAAPAAEPAAAAAEPVAPVPAPAAPARKPVARKVVAKRVEEAEPAPAPAEAEPEAPPAELPTPAPPAEPPAEGGPPRRAARPAKAAKPAGQRRVISPTRPTPAAVSELPARRLRRRPRRPTTSKPARRAPAPPPKVVPVLIAGALPVKELASALDSSPGKVLAALLGMGVMADINRVIEPELAVQVGAEMGREISVERPEGEEAAEPAAPAPPRGEPVPRPPIVTVMGHVDHGKTTLLDFIRKTRVTEQEVGGITQHIGAYQAGVGGRPITFIDTPGHEAFTEMRARGAKVTDIAVLVVAADDGVMPQTIEAISHARAAQVPIIVAINKVDLPNANPDRVKQQLAAQGLTPEEWGGETVCVPVSAKQGTGVDQLLEMILLVADVQEFKADPNLPVAGTVVEAELDRRRGPVVTVVVAEGTLRVGDSVVAGKAYGNVRGMYDHAGKLVKEAGPSSPVQIIGLSRVPEAGDRLEAAPDERISKLVAESRGARARDDRVRAVASRVSLERLSTQVESGEAKLLKVVFKADVHGSAEAIVQALSELGNEEVQIQVIHAGVGDISESDVMLASATDAVIIGFQVRIEPQARQVAEEQGIDVRIYEVIYDILNDVRAALQGMLEPVYQQVELGHAQVRQVFKISRVGTVAGCAVIEGLVQRGAQARVRRGGEVVHEGAVDSLRHLKDDVREVQSGFECGIVVGGFTDFQEGDLIEVFTTREVRRETL